MLWQTWKELFVVEDGEIIALVDEDSDLVVRGDNWMICCSVKLNRTITGFFHWFYDYLFTNNVNVLDTSVVESELF